MYVFQKNQDLLRYKSHVLTITELSATLLSVIIAADNSERYFKRLILLMNKTIKTTVPLPDPKTIKRTVFSLCLAWTLVSCGGESSPIEMKVDFDGKGSDYTSPTLVSSTDGSFYHNGFPTDLRLKDDGSVDLSDFPRRYIHPLTALYTKQIMRLQARGGYHTVTPIYLAFTGPIEVASLPSWDLDYTKPEAPIQVVDVDPNSPEYGRRFPLNVSRTVVFDSYRPNNLLQIFPTLGISLRPNTTYAAIVKKSTPTPSGYELVQNEELSYVLNGSTSNRGDIPQRAFDVYGPLRNYIAQHNIAVSSIVGATVFTTGNPAARIEKGAQFVSNMPLKTPANLKRIKNFDDYCVIQGNIGTPMFQVGIAPYLVTGGGIEWDNSGNPKVQKFRKGRFLVTIPKHTPMPAEGFPMLYFHHGAGGKADQLFDRGGVADYENDDGGNGPARIAAARGWGGAAFGGHLGQDHLDPVQGFGLFPYDVLQGIVMQNNYFQMAWERIYFRQVANQLQLNTDLCPDADPGPGNNAFKFNPDMQVSMGQSLGNWVSSLQISNDPHPFQGAILTGVAGTWIRLLGDPSNAELATAFAAANLVPGEKFDDANPYLMLLEWLLGGADPVAYQAKVMESQTKLPPHLLAFSGTKDKGALEPAQWPYLMSLGLDLAGNDRGKGYDKTLFPHMEISGARQLPYPVTANIDTAFGPRTAVVVRYNNPERANGNGHHIVFDLEAPKHQYGCFLEHLAAGEIPQVAAGNKINDPCL